MKLIKNKKGFSLAELIAAISIIAVASTTITSMIITSYKGQLRGQERLLAEQMAKTYESMFARDMKVANLKNVSDALIAPDDVTVDKFKTVNSELLNTLTIKEDGTSAQVYLALYGANPNDRFRFNDKVYDSSNVKIRIYVINKEFGYYKTQVTVSYSNDRTVTYSGSHISDLS